MNEFHGYKQMKFRDFSKHYVVWPFLICYYRVSFYNINIECIKCNNLKMYEDPSTIPHISHEITLIVRLMQTIENYFFDGRHISHWNFQNFMQEFMLYFCLKAKSNLTTYLMAVVLLYLILRYMSSSCVWSLRHDIMEQKAARKNTHAEIFLSPTL